MVASAATAMIDDRFFIPVVEINGSFDIQERLAGGVIALE